MLNDKVKQELKNAKTIDDIFIVLKNNYKIELVQLSILYKSIMIKNLEKIIDILKVEERK